MMSSGPISLPGVGEDEVDREQLLSVLRDYLSAKQLEADWQAINNAPTELPGQRPFNH